MWTPILLMNFRLRNYRALLLTWLAAMLAFWTKKKFFLVLSFPASKHQEKVFMNFFNGIFGHDVWTVHGWLHFSWSGISASSVIFKLREFYEGPPFSISYIFPLTAVFRLSFLILNTCYEHTTLVWVLQQSYLNVHWTNFVLRCS